MSKNGDFSNIGRDPLNSSVFGPKKPTDFEDKFNETMNKQWGFQLNGDYNRNHSSIDPFEVLPKALFGDVGNAFAPPEPFPKALLGDISGSTFDNKSLFDTPSNIMQDTFKNSITNQVESSSIMFDNVAPNITPISNDIILPMNSITMARNQNNECIAVPAPREQQISNFMQHVDHSMSSALTPLNTHTMYDPFKAALSQNQENSKIKKEIDDFVTARQQQLANENNVIITSKLQSIAAEANYKPCISTMTTNEYGQQRIDSWKKDDSMFSDPARLLSETCQVRYHGLKDNTLQAKNNNEHAISTLKGIQSIISKAKVHMPNLMLAGGKMYVTIDGAPDKFLGLDGKMYSNHDYASYDWKSQAQNNNFHKHEGKSLFATESPADYGNSLIYYNGITDVGSNLAQTGQYRSKLRCLQDDLLLKIKSDTYEYGMQLRESKYQAHLRLVGFFAERGDKGFSQRNANKLEACQQYIKDNEEISKKLYLDNIAYRTERAKRWQREYNEITKELKANNKAAEMQVQKFAEDKIKFEKEKSEGERDKFIKEKFSKIKDLDLIEQETKEEKVINQVAKLNLLTDIMSTLIGDEEAKKLYIDEENLRSRIEAVKSPDQEILKVPEAKPDSQEILKKAEEQVKIINKDVLDSNNLIDRYVSKLKTMNLNPDIYSEANVEKLKEFRAYEVLHKTRTFKSLSKDTPEVLKECLYSFIPFKIKSDNFSNIRTKVIKSTGKDLDIDKQEVDPYSFKAAKNAVVGTAKELLMKNPLTKCVSLTLNSETMHNAWKEWDHQVHAVPNGKTRLQKGYEKFLEMREQNRAILNHITQNMLDDIGQALKKSANISDILPDVNINTTDDIHTLGVTSDLVEDSDNAI